jgi:UDP-N-acetylglucosamine transferase subunit ALG13
LIFVSVGTNERPFNRLIAAVDQLAEHSPDSFLIQTGHSTYQPRFAAYFYFGSIEKMQECIRTAELVISQAGFGIIGDCIAAKKKLILVPREKKYGEAVDNQVELADYLGQMNVGILYIQDLSKLADSIEQQKNSRTRYCFETRIPLLIKDTIHEQFRTRIPGTDFDHHY